MSREHQKFDDFAVAVGCVAEGKLIESCVVQNMVVAILSVHNFHFYETSSASFSPFALKNITLTKRKRKTL